MATMPSYFLTALSNIQPAQDEKNAAVAHAEVSRVLCGFDKLKALGISPILIGSYAREVSIRRVKDVDVFGRMTKADDKLGPGEAMNLFETALVAKYGDRVERQLRSFKVNFPDFDLSVDLKDRSCRSTRSPYLATSAVSNRFIASPGPSLSSALVIRPNTSTSLTRRIDTSRAYEPMSIGLMPSAFSLSKPHRTLLTSACATAAFFSSCAG